MNDGIGQFRSVIDPQFTLSDYLKLKYLKILVSGNANLAMADFAYSCRKYKDALRVLEQELRQP